MSSRAFRALYRLCLRQAADLQQLGRSLEFRRPLDKGAYALGNASIRWTRPNPAYNIDSFRTLLPWTTQVMPERGVFTAGEARELIRQGFRHPMEAASEAELLDRAINTLRTLSEQIYLMQCSSSSQAEGVAVEVTSGYLGRTSDLDPMHDPDDDDDKFFYTYRVRIANTSDKTIQVLARHWAISDSRGRTVEVKRWSPGVVGARPVLEPQDCFEYYSSVPLETRDGEMRGAFQFGELDIQARKREPVRLFEVGVQPFKLQPPRQ